jgi:hypothetical protein
MFIKSVTYIFIICFLILKLKANHLAFCEKEDLNEKCASRQSYFSNKRLVVCIV